MAGEKYMMSLVALEAVGRRDLQRFEVGFPERVCKPRFDEPCLRAIGRDDPHIASKPVVGRKAADDGPDDPVRLRGIHAASPARSRLAPAGNADPLDGPQAFRRDRGTAQLEPGAVEAFVGEGGDRRV